MLAILAFPAGHAAAQTEPSPRDPPAADTLAAWPGESGAPPAGTPPLMSDPRPACMVEFARLRGELEAKGREVRAARQRHAPRDEMCGYITTYADAEATWVRFAEAGAQTCGIPAQFVNQLKRVHA